MGVEEFLSKLSKLMPDAVEIAKEVLTDAARDVYSASQDLVPVATGRLKESGTVTPAFESKKGEIQAGVFYGGAALEALLEGDESPLYAIKVHEDLSWKHVHGQAKFLEVPFLLYQETLMTNLRNSVWEAMHAN